MKTYLLRHLPVFALLLLLYMIIFSCKEEIKPVNTDNWQPGLAFPIAHASLNLGDMITENNQYFIIGEDSSIHFFFRQDSVLSFDVNDLATIPVQQDKEAEFKLGIIELDNFGPITAEATLNDMLDVVDSSLAADIQNLDGTTAVFPAMQSVYQKSFDFMNFDAFEYVTFSEGKLILQIVNNLPVAFSSCEIVLYTISPDSIFYDIGNFSYSNFLPYTSRSDSLQLAGLTLYNDFKVVITSFETLESSSPVTINLTDGLSFTLNSENLKVIGGKAKIPSQLLTNQEDSVQVTIDEQERITYFALDEAHINYSVESDIDMGLSFTMDLPTVTISGQPVQFVFSGTNQSQGVLDLSYSNFDLTQNPNQPYNSWPVLFTFELQGTNSWIEFDSSSTVKLAYSIDYIEFASAQGWFGVKNIDVDTSVVNLNISELNNLSGSIILSDPKLKIIVNNSIGIPVGFNLKLVNSTNEGNDINLNTDMLYLPYPEIFGIEVTNEVISIDNNNSNLSEFMSQLPDLLSMSGEVISNPDSVNTGLVYSNFITNEGKVNIGLEFELPLALSINNLQFSDTLDFSFNQNSFDESMSGHISIFTVNGIPFEIQLLLTFVDSTNYSVLDNYNFDFLEAAEVDNDGRVVETKEKTNIIELDKERFDRLNAANKVIVTAIVNTTNSSNQEVVFYTDYTLQVHLAALLNYSINLSY